MGEGTITIGGFDHVKAVTMGDGFPVVIQTMWKDRLSFAGLKGRAGDALVRRIEDLAAMGCGLLRFAVPGLQDAEILGALAGMVSMPLCADIHFDYKIALRCLDFPIAKLRINPGTIGNDERTRAVFEKAAARQVPVRIGINAGSLPLSLRSAVEQGTSGRAEALVSAALDELALFKRFGSGGEFPVIVSMKASGIADTIKANRLFRERSGVPLHIGVTEAGPLVAGTVRNTAALLFLLAEGTGDTIRVSLSDTMENEVVAGREILAAAAELAKSEGRAARPAPEGVTIVSCPLCGRNGFDTHAFTGRWMKKLYALDKTCTIAVMGCAVNGPGEAKHADMGITGAGNKVLIFRRGKVIRTIDADDETVDRAFAEELALL